MSRRVRNAIDRTSARLWLVLKLALVAAIWFTLLVALVWLEAR